MASAPTTTPSALGQGAADFTLDQLLLDANNPRFGDPRTFAEQVQVLDHIVSNYGVDDVLSSLAVNGYFQAEPLVGRISGQQVIIIEGNRRLAACLILSEDPRAVNQAKKTAQYKTLWTSHGQKPINPVPVITFATDENDPDLLSYLGVRHISASAPWDSYAKASWAAKVVNATNLTVSDISVMIGDPHRTVARLLEGYYVINQVIREGYFDPADSVRKGRGSVTEYPFSWVYTILGYTAARRFLDMADSEPRPDPIPTANLQHARTMLIAMFGSQSQGLNSAIRDSRALGDLASALIDRQMVEMLQRGMVLTEVARLTRPLGERLSENLAEVRRLQTELVTIFAEQAIAPSIAEENLPQAAANRRTASSLEKSLHDILHPGSPE